MTRTSFTRTAVQHKQPERDAIQSDVDAFLARGGKIQYLAPGEASSLTIEEVKTARRKEALRRRNVAVEES